MKTFNERSQELNLKLGRTVRTTAELNFSKTSGIIPVGTVLDVYFSDVRPDRLYFRYDSDTCKSLPFSIAYKFLTGFSKPPGEKTMFKWMNDGIAKTVFGARTEPDGFGPNHEPSWLLALGLI
jgi:hypothetical protein